MPDTDIFGKPLPVVNGSGKQGGRVYAVDRRLLNRFLNAIGDPDLSVALWDGEEAVGPGPRPKVGMLIRDRSTLWRLLTNPLLNFGDDYSAGRIEIKGGLVAFMETIYRALARSRMKRPGSQPTGFWRNRTDMNSRSRSFRNIHQHYDIGNDFYRLWLDREMLYTCGYFPDPAMSLEEAQVAKMDLVCRKLRLRPGQTVVEAGSGWGGLARYMARNYRVTVRAFNISRQQILYAREKAESEGLGQQVEYVEDDYRSITGKYDAFVSVGMLEHVGTRYYGELRRVVDRSLQNRGSA